MPDAKLPVVTRRESRDVKTLLLLALAPALVLALPSTGMAQKAVEMGASRLQPVITRHTQVARLNLRAKMA